MGQLDSSLLMVAGLVALMGSILVLLYPSLGIGLLVTIPVVKTLVQMRMGPLLGNYTYDIAVAVVALIAAAVHRLRAGQGRPLGVPVSAIVAWIALVVLIWGTIPISRHPDYGFKKALIFSIFNTMAVAAIVLYVTSSRDARVVLRVILVAGVGASLALPAFGSGWEHRWYEGARQTLGLANPLMIADVAAYTVVILLSRLLAFRNMTSAMLLVLTVPPAALAIYMTQTRGPFVAIPIVLLAMLWFYRRQVSFRAAGLTIGVLAIAAYVSSVLIDPSRGERFTEAAITQGISERTAMFRMTVFGFFRSPVLGNGAGDTAYQITGGNFVETYPHNHVLEVANELGLGGLAAWCWLVGLGLISVWGLTAREWDNSEAKYVGVTIFGLLVYNLLMSLKTGTFAASNHLYMFLFATIVLAAHRRIEAAGALGAGRFIGRWRSAEDERVLAAAQQALAPRLP